MARLDGPAWNLLGNWEPETLDRIRPCEEESTAMLYSRLVESSLHGTDKATSRD